MLNSSYVYCCNNYIVKAEEKDKSYTSDNEYTVFQQSHV